MIHADREVAGTILSLRCEACGSVFPHFLFLGDGDSSTAGLCSASRCRKDEVVIAEVDSSEWGALAVAESSSIEARLMKEFSLADLKVVRLLRVEHGASAAGSSFGDFRKAYKPPIQIYSCVCCVNGEARSIEAVEVKRFEDSGGRILLSGRLTLRRE
jgi:hypothetical protein